MLHYRSAAGFLRFMLILGTLAPAMGAEAARLPDDGVPEVIRVGAGSYASRPPRDQNRRPHLEGRAGWGDESQRYSRMRLYVDPAHQGPVPSTGWWTSLVSRQWSGDLWSYPAVVRAVPTGITIATPKRWSLNGNRSALSLEPTSRLHIGAQVFQPLHAEAVSWGDWSVRFRLPDAQGRALVATIVHGMPLTWVECVGVEPWIDIGAATLFTGTKPATAPVTGDRIGIDLDGDLYAVYAPANTRFIQEGSRLVPHFAGNRRWLAVAVLSAAGDLDTFAAHASVIPRDTRVAWRYEPAQGKVDTEWIIDSEDLNGGTRRDVLQGWIPHHYHAPAKPDFNADGARYVTPRGELRLATGHHFRIALPFTGLLPEYPTPEVLPGDQPYRPEAMRELVRAHLGRTGYGSETYWGGKRILLFARYMEIARQMGMTAETAVFRDRAAEAVRDWLTFDPGEGEHFFAWYPNWGSLVGCRSRDNANPGVDVLQDHHMCYGYHVYAAALLALQDPAFGRDWGPMATLVAKDYANWDREDLRFCTFRNLDPWCGHSWSGGMGSDHGNGQESSSEAMQGWGAMFLLGEALGDTAMRDAAAFGWALEARGTAEYYFDRNQRNWPQEWPYKVAANLHTEGMGYWTWFSGNPFWMHAIQWLPMSPLLSYLGEDRAFAARDFARMWTDHEGGRGWNGYLGTDTGVSNIAMNYLATSDAAAAATVFHDLLDRGQGGVRGAEPGPTYWRIHALRRLGPHRFDAWTDVATSSAFGQDGGPISWVVFNASDAPRAVRCFRAGQQVATFTAPPRRLSVWREGTLTSCPGPMAPIPPLVAAIDDLPLSEGRPATASSTQGRNQGPEQAVDGDPRTRWASRATDAEWIAVDLGRRCRIDRVVLHWEGAFGTDYDIEGSDDGTTWRTLAEVRGGDGGEDEVIVAGEARHVRLLGRKRGTQWGWSLYAFAVHGVPLGGSVQRLEIEPSLAVLTDRQTTRFAAFAIDAAGKRRPVQATWRVAGPGRIAADGTFTPEHGGTFDQPRVAIIAEADGLRGRAHAAVEETLRVARIELTPSGGGAPIEIPVGGRLSVTARVIDQFGVAVAAKPQWTVTGPLRRDGEAIVGTALGEGAVRVALGGVHAELAIAMVPPERVDIAAGGVATASSVQAGGMGPEMAVDRDPRTRWASQASDPQWLAVDLGGVQAVQRIVLEWEGAHARVYRIEASDDGVAWRDIHRQDAGKGRREEIILPQAVRARHLRLVGETRATRYGYSLFTFATYPPAR